MEGTAPLKRSNLLFQEGERLDTLLVPIFVVLRTIMIRGFAFGGWTLSRQKLSTIVSSINICGNLWGEMTDFYSRIIKGHTNNYYE